MLATIAFGGWKLAGNGLTIASAQLAVSGEKGKYPEFAGNVKAVEARDFWRDVDVSPKNQGYHYNRNAETYKTHADAPERPLLYVPIAAARGLQLPSQRRNVEGADAPAGSPRRSCPGRSGSG